MNGLQAGGVAGFLLAGGLSSRMGSNKALLRLEGETLVELGLRKLAQVCGPVAIAGGVAELFAFGRVIPDLYKEQGPLGGIVSALESSECEWNLFVAVDMPLLPAAALGELLQAVDRTTQVTLAQAAGAVQPLCGIYSRRALPTLRAELLKGNRRVRAAVEATGSFAFWQAADPAWFANVNTPQEFAAAQQQARA